MRDTPESRDVLFDFHVRRLDRHCAGLPTESLLVQDMSDEIVRLRAENTSFRAEINRLLDILAALREPSAEVSDAANKSFYSVDTLKSLSWAIRAAVTAAEQEVGRE